MKWLIDAEWYDTNKYQPPIGEEVLCAVKSSELVWDETTKSFKREPIMRVSIGSRGPYCWYIHGLYNKQRADVAYWTWLPRIDSFDTGWVVEHEEND
jgi:hypothetical protein